MAAGNIGHPLAEVALNPGAYDAVVVEVSSFQLETTRTFKPHVALFLNLTPDHLDRHGSIEAYGTLKARIFEQQGSEDWLVYNVGDERVTRLVQQAESKRLPFNVPPLPEDGGYVQNGWMVIRFDGEPYDLVEISQMGLRGEHNVLNGLAASLAALAMNCPIEAIRETLTTFTGLPHRMERVRVLGGVEWINDSKATNVDAVWYALGGFTQPIVLIAGGRDKDSDFTQLSDRIRQQVKALVLIGEAADKMARAWSGLAPISRADSLKAALTHARALAQPGDVVLLSPACASFDMFKNYEDRGDQFRTLVRQWEGEA